MRAYWKGLGLASLLLGVVLTGCEQQDVIAPSQSDAPAASVGSTLGGYSLATDPLASGLADIRVSKLIDPAGGELTLLGHTLRVPAGAVPQPTLFALTVLPTGYVQVDLHAVLPGAAEVGSKGFLRPVQVELSYARATNVANPSALRILRIKGLSGVAGRVSDSYEVIPSTVDPQAQTVRAQLEHFSKYALGWPD